MESEVIAAMELAHRIAPHGYYVAALNGMGEQGCFFCVVLIYNGEIIMRSPTTAGLIQLIRDSHYEHILSASKK